MSSFCSVARRTLSSSYGSLSRCRNGQGVSSTPCFPCVQPPAHVAVQFEGSVLAPNRASNSSVGSPSKPIPFSPLSRSRPSTTCCKAMAPNVTQTVDTMTPACPPECADFAHVLADKAADVIAKYFRMPIDVQIKLDKSPVTIADETVEAEMRALLRERFPAHAILGEEGGLDLGSGDGEYTWILDPIDGTASFITGKPLFGVLIALTHKGVPVLGVLDQPILKERWLGVRNGGDVTTTFNGQPVNTRSCTDLGSAYLYSTSPHLFKDRSETAFARVRENVRKVNYGCDCYAFGLLALGFVDLVIEHGLKPWDYLALVPIVEGAGGVITDWSGRPLRLDSTNPSDWVDECVAAGDRAAHKAALEALAWEGSHLGNQF